LAARPPSDFSRMNLERVSMPSLVFAEVGKHAADGDFDWILKGTVVSGIDDYK
jgi:hypothetical protein